MEAERNYHGGPWRCFHCDDVFTTVGAASDHFGPHPAATPGCVIDKVLPEGGVNTQRGLGLLMALRKAEAELARYREEDTDLHRALHAKDCERQQAVQRAEEQGYARGLRDGVNLPADSPERAAIAGLAPSEKVQLPEKARAGIEVLHRVVESLLTTSRYVDEEGEATMALADLSACIADPPFTLAKQPGWLSESFGRFLREKGCTDEQIAAECAANGLPAPAGVPVATAPDERAIDAELRRVAQVTGQPVEKVRAGFNELHAALGVDVPGGAERG